MKFHVEAPAAFRPSRSLPLDIFRVPVRAIPLRRRVRLLALFPECGYVCLCFGIRECVKMFGKWSRRKSFS